MALDPLAAYSNEIARAFGLPPAKTVAQLRLQLRDVCPVATAASIGDVLEALAGSKGSRARKLLAELDDLVAAATYDRTKRAERGRLFAVLLVVFDLVSLTGAATDPDDPEATLKLVRRARR